MCAAATSDAGRFLRKYVDENANTGVIRVGSEADLVLLAENPLESIRNAASVTGVMSDGRWFPAGLSPRELGGLRPASPRPARRRREKVRPLFPAMEKSLALSVGCEITPGSPRDRRRGAVTARKREGISICGLTARGLSDILHQSFRGVRRILTSPDRFRPHRVPRGHWLRLGSGRKEQ